MFTLIAFKLIIIYYRRVQTVSGDFGADMKTVLYLSIRKKSPSYVIEFHPTTSYLRLTSCQVLQRVTDERGKGFTIDKIITLPLQLQLRLG